MGMKLLAQEPFVDLRRGYYFHDDFEEYTDAKRWTAALTNSSAPTITATAQDGVLAQLNTGATNDASFIFTTSKIGLWANDKVHVCECLIQFTEASTNNANIWFGFTSVNTVAMLVNGSAGPATSGTFAGIYKTGGTLGWRTASSQSTTQTLTNSGNFTTAGQSGYQRLRVQVEIINSVAEVTYFIDQGSGMQQVKDSTTRQNLIKDVISLSSPAAMYFGIGIKNGTSAAEQLNVDYVAAWKHRSNFVASS